MGLSTFSFSSELRSVGPSTGDLIGVLRVREAAMKRTIEAMIVKSNSIHGRIATRRTKIVIDRINIETKI